MRTKETSSRTGPGGATIGWGEGSKKQGGLVGPVTSQHKRTALATPVGRRRRTGREAALRSCVSFAHCQSPKSSDEIRCDSAVVYSPQFDLIFPSTPGRVRMNQTRLPLSAEDGFRTRSPRRREELLLLSPRFVPPTSPGLSTAVRPKNSTSDICSRSVQRGDPVLFGLCRAAAAGRVSAACVIRSRQRDVGVQFGAGKGSGEMFG